MTVQSHKILPAIISSWNGPPKVPTSTPLKNMWTALRRRAKAEKLTNLVELYQFCQVGWSKIQLGFGQKCTDGYRKRLNE